MTNQIPIREDIELAGQSVVPTVTVELILPIGMFEWLLKRKDKGFFTLHELIRSLIREIMHAELYSGLK